MRLLALAAFAGLLATTAHADQRTNSYSVAPGNCSMPIALPLNSKPVFMMGSQITAPQQGGGHVSIVRTNTPNQLLSWAGVDYFAGEERNYALASPPGVHIMWLDYGGAVDVQTATSSRVQVCNKTGSGISRAVGYLTFMW